MKYEFFEFKEPIEASSNLPLSKYIFRYKLSSATINAECFIGMRTNFAGRNALRGN